MAGAAGSMVSAPFSMVLLTAILTQVGALQTAPDLLAVATSFLTVEAVQFALSQRQVGGDPTPTSFRRLTGPVAAIDAPSRF